MKVLHHTRLREGSSPNLEDLYEIAIKVKSVGVVYIYAMWSGVRMGYRDIIVCKSPFLEIATTIIGLSEYLWGPRYIGHRKLKLNRTWR